MKKIATQGVLDSTYGFALTVFQCDCINLLFFVFGIISTDDFYQSYGGKYYIQCTYLKPRTHTMSLRNHKSPAQSLNSVCVCASPLSHFSRNFSSQRRNLYVFSAPPCTAHLGPPGPC